MRPRHLVLLGFGLSVPGLVAVPVLACSAALSGQTADPAVARPEPASAKVDEEPRADAAAARSDEVDRGTPVATPPGTVLIPAETQVAVGTPVDDAEKLIRAHPARGASIAGETPQHRVRVDAFHLGASEVTNEQFREFVLATGHRAPQHWGEAALAAARRAHLEEYGQRRKAAQDAGQPIPAPTDFDPHTWWERNWKTVEWEMPPAIAAAPVTWVDYGDAVAYARWAGMRLMTEAEYLAAGRGKDGKKLFPWGAEWDPTRAGAAALGSSAVPVKVGTYPGGATEHGVHDLIGNAWEWTASPYTRFPGYKDLKVTIEERGKQRPVDTMPKWDADERVVVGGSVQNPGGELRLSMRRGAQRSQRTNALGFRVAASTKPGLDRASALQVGRSFGKESPAFSRMVAIDRWYSKPGSGTLSAPDGKGGEGAAEGNLYAVVSAYEYVLALPPERLDHVSLNALANATLTDGPVPFAILSTSMTLVEPALPPGDYVVAYRAPGKSRGKESKASGDEAVDQMRQDGEAAAPAASAVEFDTNVANYLFSTLDGELVAALRAPTHPTYEKPARDMVNGQIAMVLDEKGKQGGDRIAMTIVVPGRASQTNAFIFQLPLVVERGTLAGPWRR